MDFWKYFAVGHARHVICNPLSIAKLDELIDGLDLPAGARVLDIACGKGEFAIRTARRWECEVVGVDLSPPFVADARARVEAAGLDARVRIIEADGKDYRDEPASFDAAFCFGATWIWQGYGPTLEALARFVRPGGIVGVGEPFWHTEPSPGYLELAGLKRGDFDRHAGNVRTGIDLGLGALRSFVSSQDDWDRYEGLQWHVAELYARAHPDDPDLPELMAGMRRARDAYLGGGREQLGWAVYLFLVDPWRAPDPTDS